MLHCIVSIIIKFHNIILQSHSMHIMHIIHTHKNNKSIDAFYSSLLHTNNIVSTIIEGMWLCGLAQQVVLDPTTEMKKP